MIAQGTVEDLGRNPASQIGPFLTGQARVQVRQPSGGGGTSLPRGRLHLSTGAIHTVKPLEVDLPKGRLTVVTGVSGSGKTTLILESLLPALEAAAAGSPLPAHVKGVEAGGITRAKLIDATPIGLNVRSTVATYANVHDELRKAFAKTPAAKALGVQGGGLFLQHRPPPLPHLRRHRERQPGRAVPPRCGHPLPHLPGQPV